MCYAVFELLVYYVIGGRENMEKRWESGKPTFWILCSLFSSSSLAWLYMKNIGASVIETVFDYLVFLLNMLLRRL